MASRTQREIRGRILKALLAAYPYRLDLAKLYEVIADASLPAMPHAIKTEAAWLYARSYVKPFGDDSWSLDTRGKELLDGLFEDPEVVLPVGA